MSAVVGFDARDAVAPERRGWGRYTERLLAALLAAAPADIEIWPLTDGGGGPEVLFEQVRLPLALRRRKADVVHTPNCFLPLGRPCPGVVTIHDLAFEAWPEDFAPRTRIKYRTLTRLAARSAQRIICPSRFTAEDVCARYGVDPEKVRVIPEAPALPAPEAGAPREPAAVLAGIEASERERRRAPYVLAVGDLRAKKNLAALVSAFVRVRRRGGLPHRLLLVGMDAGAGATLRRLAAGEPVEILGYVSDARLDALLRGADLLVHPSLYEGFGLVLLEAMARGTPVLAARATALPETGGEAAAWFEAGAAEALAAELERLLADGDARADLSRRGLEHAGGFSWERAARQTLEVYRELI